MYVVNSVIDGELKRTGGPIQASQYILLSPNKGAQPFRVS